MKLKRYGIRQNLTVFVITVLITACLSLLYGNLLFYRQAMQLSRGCQTAVMLGNEIVFSGPDITEFEVRSVLMDVSAGKTESTIEGLGRLVVSREQYVGRNGVLYTLLKMTPIPQTGALLRRLLLFVLSVFAAGFGLMTLLNERKNNRAVVTPLLQLKKAADRLSAGEVSMPIPLCGIGEVAELASAMESLRLKLCDSVQKSGRTEEERIFLLSSISHDLKTPVTAVRGYVEGVLDGVADTPERQRYYLQKAVQKLAMLTTMIDDLLLYSRLDSGRLPYSFSYVSIEELIRQQTEEFRPLFVAEHKRLELKNQLRTAAVLRLDAERFQRVVQNILNNALQHIKPHTGCVTVSLRETENSVIMEFRDNGSGIAPEVLPHIFERFYRADSARTADGGSGLGLAIARQLVTGMHGQIWAVSPPNEGCAILISMKKSSGVPLQTVENPILT